MRKTTEDREHELLAAIVAGQKAKGYAPTRRELAKEIGISTSRVQQIVESCIQRGYLARVPRAARVYIVHDHATPLVAGTCQRLPSDR